MCCSKVIVPDIDVGVAVLVGMGNGTLIVAMMGYGSALVPYSMVGTLSGENMILPHSKAYAASGGEMHAIWGSWGQQMH